MSALESLAINVNSNHCMGCGKCVRVCSRHAITIKNSKAIVDASACNECGACFATCPQKAIRMGDHPPEQAVLDLATRGNVETILKLRRTCRTFTPLPIPKETLQQLIGTLRYCPSCKNQQLVKFAVVSRAVIDKIAPKVAKHFEDAQQYPNEDVSFRGCQHLVVAYALDQAKNIKEDALIALTTLDLLLQSQGYGSYFNGRIMTAISKDASIVQDLKLPGFVIGVLGVGNWDKEYAPIRGVARRAVPVEFV